MNNNDPRNSFDRKRWRLKFGILESFILFFLLFFGGFFLSEYYQETITAKQQAERLFLQSARNVQLKLTHFQSAATAILQISRAYHEAGILNPDNVQSANTLFTAHMQQYPFISSINIGDGRGNGYLLLRTGQQSKNRIKRAEEKEWVTWFTLDAAGKIVAAERVRDDYEPRITPWYQKSVNHNEIVWSSPYKFRTTGDIGITASLWLGSKDGRNEVVGVDIMLKDLSHFLAEMVTEKGMLARLLTDDGTLVACSDFKNLLSRLQQEGAGLPRVGSGDLPLIETALKFKTEERPFWSFSFGDKKILAFMEPLSFTASGRYKLLLTVPEGTFVGNSVRNALWKMGISLFLLAVVSTWYIVHYLLPLRRINIAIKAFGAGKFKGLAVKTARADEIGALAANFIAMTESLRQQDELLRESEDRLRRLGDNLPASYLCQYQYEADGRPRFLYISAGVETLHGVSQKEVLRDAYALNRQLDKEGLRAIVAAERLALKGMTDLQMQVLYRRSDGEQRWLLLHARPHCNADGRVIWDGVATDITARLRTEEALLEQADFTRSLIENLVPATFVLDAQHKIVLWNHACEELTGLARAELIGTDNHWQAFYDHPRPCLADVALDADDNGGANHYDTSTKSALVAQGLHAEGWYKNLRGHDRYLLFDAAPIYDRAGKLCAAIETIQDGTELKRGEESLRLQSTALNAAANAIVITSKNGTIEWVNPSFTALSGYSAAEARGKKPGELVKSGMHDQAFYQELWETLLAGEIWRGEMTNRRKDGTFYPEGQTITPVKDDDGVITHFIAIKRDLTEQRKLEEQLRQSQKMESLGTLAGGIAHDFNNILTTISGYGQISLMKLPADDPLRSNIKSILEAVDRAVRLTQQMLMFSRKQVCHKRTLELNDVIIYVGKFLQKVIGEDIEIKTILSPEPLYLQADAHQLEQVLMNLATNASHAMPQGGTLTLVTKTVVLNRDFTSAHGYGAPGAYALLSVTDSGSGMDEETRQRIFEPFFTTKEVGKGTGLGLSVVYGIIKEHAGYINVYSEPGIGSTFRIYLPLSAERTEEAGQIPAEAAIGGSETILLAEDDKMVREMTRDLLTEFGYTVISAEDGAEAVRKFTEQGAAIDLLLFDLIMPKMNGQEALDEIRKVRHGIKAIFSSGYAPETIRQKATLANGVHLISKPMLPTELLKKVRQVLDGG